ncbi:hypothetical protein [Paenarthrobacter sp.]|uniref:hypothetical protein n=1 Tax=Paenarthrobacter sp. TaxID=1931993 RepID=UPI0028115B76|nr:hypothetical protein [Paenarthrobacter sp.]
MGTAADLFDVAGRTTIRSADGAFFHLGGPLEASKPLDSRISQELRERRVADGRPVLGRESIGIVASAQVASGLLRSLGDAGIAAAVVKDAGDSESPGLLLHIAGSPAERSHYDGLPCGGTAVLRCYREGDLVFIDPLSMSGQDPTSSQVLRRRLAASPAATELKAWLDTPAASMDLDLQATTLGLVTARLLTIIRAWQRNSPVLPALRRTLWRLDSGTFAVSEHPVLPFPEPAKLDENWPATR